MRVPLASARERASMPSTGTSACSTSASRMASSSWARAPSKRFTAITNGMPRASQKSTEGKASSMRRLSTRITAPMAPRVTSSQANRKRDWPGVPNR